MIYVDNNATTPVDPAVVEAMQPFWCDNFFNASASYGPAKVTRQAVMTAREQVASAIGANANEVVFTSGGTEADNLALAGAARMAATGRRTIILGALEHEAVLNQRERLEQWGFSVKVLRPDAAGRYDHERLLEMLDDSVAVVALMWANNETGVIMDIARHGDAIKSTGAHFHCDAVQALGRIVIDTSALPVDSMAFSGHKIEGPKGIGALYLRQGAKLAPQLLGGGQENGWRSGTQPVPLIVGLGLAAQGAVDRLSSSNDHCIALRDGLESALCSRHEGLQVNGADGPRLANTLNVCFHRLESDSLLMALDMAGICASSGSACSSEVSEPSHVLKAMGLGRDYLAGALRFSFSRHNHQSDVKTIVDAVDRAVSMLG